MKLCSIKECSNKSKAKGLCNSCYQLYRQGNTIEQIIIKRFHKPKTERPRCKLDGCWKIVRAQGYCPNHYRMLLKGYTQDQMKAASIQVNKDNISSKLLMKAKKMIRESYYDAKNKSCFIHSVRVYKDKMMRIRYTGKDGRRHTMMVAMESNAML